MSIYRQFLFDFKSDDETNETSPYIQKITQLIADGDSCLNLDCGDLRAFPTTATLYSQLVNFPTKVIPILDSVLIDVARELNPDESSLPPHLHVPSLIPLHTIDARVQPREEGGNARSVHRRHRPAG